MLKIDDTITFEATARINLKALQASFGIRCKLLDIEALDALREQWIGKRATETETAVPPTLHDRQFIDHWLVGFAPDVTLGADGAPAEFTPENVSRLLAMPGAKQAVLNAFFDGYAEAEQGNSAPSRAG